MSGRAPGTSWDVRPLLGIVVGVGVGLGAALRLALGVVGAGARGPVWGSAPRARAAARRSHSLLAAALSKRMLWRAARPEARHLLNPRSLLAMCAARQVPARWTG